MQQIKLKSKHLTFPRPEKFKLTLNTDNSNAIKFGKKPKRTNQVKFLTNLFPGINTIMYLGVHLDTTTKIF